MTPTLTRAHLAASASRLDAIADRLERVAVLHGPECLELGYDECDRMSRDLRDAQTALLRARTMLRADLCAGSELETIGVDPAFGLEVVG